MEPTKNALVSIFMIVQSGERFIRQALESIFTQSGKGASQTHAWCKHLDTNRKKITTI